MVALALICAVSCAKIDDGSSAVAPEQPVQPTVLLPTRSYEEALSLARKSIALGRPGPNPLGHCPFDPQRTRPMRHYPVYAQRVGSDTLMYVFNFEGDDGFSIIAANRAVDPVLAVAEKGNYTYGEPTGVENFDFYMDVMAQSLAVIKPPKFDTIRTTPKFKTVEVNESRSCEPLIPVNWGQGFPYGDYCSNKTSGCVATAIAQIMAYYRFPASITTTYTDAPHAGETIALNWTSMISYPYVYQVPALMREIGQRVGMRYYPEYENDKRTGSGAASSNVPSCMISFGYSCASGLASYAIASIRTNLDEKHPVYVRANDISEGGHAWIADGYIYSRIGTEYYEEILIDNGLTLYYDYILTNSTVQTTNLVHYNWGWDGSCDGYFAPGNGVASGNGYIFDGLQMITSIRLPRIDSNLNHDFL